MVAGVTAVIPVLEYLHQPWEKVESAEAVQQHMQEGRTVWLLYTFPVYLKAAYPEIWQLIVEQGEHVAEFEGTIAGGTIYVCRFQPTVENVPRTPSSGDVSF